MDKKKLNVVLVTMKGYGNFGTCLQSYALHKKLGDIGYNVSFLSYLPPHYNYKSYIKNILRLMRLETIAKKIWHYNNSLQEKKRERFQKYNYNEINIFTKNQEKKLVEKTDCFITGSDQIWNTYYHFFPFYFLSFARNKKRVAYASSIGTSDIKKEYQEVVRSLLIKFDHIGVREYQAVDVLSSLTGRSDIRQVLDPTFLLEPNEWKDFTCSAKYEITLPQEYIFCYLIGNNSWYKEQLYDVRCKLGIKNIIIIPAAENPNFRCEGATIYKNASPVEFVDLLQRAKCVCTDSFHATALSINHSIQFIEFMRFRDDDMESQNSRIYDLLNSYGLNNRIYRNTSTEWEKDINYGYIQFLLKQNREESLAFLINSIEN